MECYFNHTVENNELNLRVFCNKCHEDFSKNDAMVCIADKGENRVFFCMYCVIEICRSFYLEKLKSNTR